MPDDISHLDDDLPGGEGLTAKYRPIEPADLVPPERGPPALTSGPPTIPGYDIVGELGRGGMGVVFKAWQVRAKRFVALKMVVPGSETDAAALQRFRTEAEAVKHLSHPNIVQIYDFGEQNGWPFFSLEFCAGGSLARKLSGNPMVPQAAAALVEKIARAVASAHRQQIVHRDLKPANILLTQQGEPKIGDFGLAKKLDSDALDSKSGTLLGTANYIPFEQATGLVRAAGPSADVYALGAILYECLTGRPPFKGASALDTLDQIRHQEIIPPRLFERKIPRDLETICLKCLSKNPAKRYSTADELADDLHRIFKGKSIRARPRGHVERLYSFAKRKPIITAAFVFCSLLLLCSLVGNVVAVLKIQEIRNEKSKVDEELRKENIRPQEPVE